MSNLRLDLEQEVRKFLLNEINNETRKKVDYDPETLAVLGVSTIAEAYDLGQGCTIWDFLRLPSRFVDGRVVDLRGDLLDALSGHAKGKCVKPAKLAGQILDGLKHVSVNKFLDEDIIDLEGREQKLRVTLEEQGYKLIRARTRNPRAPEYGNFHVMLAETREINIFAPHSLEGLEQWSPSEAVAS